MAIDIIAQIMLVYPNVFFFPELAVDIIAQIMLVYPNVFFFSGVECDNAGDNAEPW